MIQGPTLLAPAGSTGNNTHTAVRLPDQYEGLAFQFVVEAAGATPTVTYKFQGSMDGTNWYDLVYVTDANNTDAVATRSLTATGASVQFLSNPLARNYRYARCVTTLNTNITYRAEVYPV